MIDPISIYLAKLIGLALIIIGISLFSKPQDYQDTLKDVAKSNAIMTFISIVPLILGLAIVIAHNVWIEDWTVIITIIGWCIFLSGILRLFFHKKLMNLYMKIANKKRFFMIWGIILFFVGLYLAAKGFYYTEPSSFNEPPTF